MDISDVLRRFSERRWSRADGRDLLVRLASALGGQFDLDDGAGEDWGSLQIDYLTRAYVSMLGPLILAVDSIADEIREHAGPGITLVVVPDLQSPVLSCDAAALEMAFGVRATRSAALSPSAFAAEDLWFATI